MLRLLSHRLPVFPTLPIILVLAFFLYTYRESPISQTTLQTCESAGNQPKQAESVSVDPRCGSFSDPGNIQITIRTGATEAYEKLLPLLLTNLGCSKRIEIFSDLEENIGTYHLHDALKDFDSEMKLNHPEFEIYRSQQEYQATGQDIRELGKKHKAVWDLDKYKFMHMVQKTWDLNPKVDWYLFIEADTYVFWDNLVQWLGRLDPSEKLLMGSEAEIEGQWFAHGGSGFVLSGALLKRFAGDDPQMATRNDKILMNACCGDMILARAVQKYQGVKVQNNWPWINGETPWSVPYGPDYWCKPVITFHHINPRQRNLIWDFEKNRTNTKEPLLFRDISELAFPTGHLKEHEEDWDNLSEDPVDNPGGSPHTFETCRRACTYRDGCWQYRYSDGECNINMKGFRLGAKRAPVAGKTWISGWKPDKIEAFRKERICRIPEWRDDDYGVRDSVF